MEYRIQLGDRQLQVEASRLDEDGRTVITVDGQRHEVAVRPVRAQETQLIGPGGQRRVFAVRDGGGIWVWSGGRARHLTDAAQRRTGGPDGGGPATVTPPMPAVVTKVLVQVGDEVESGQALVVVSAMKMEMTLTAPHAGTVAAIHTAEGAKANPGDILVDIEPAAEED